MSIIPGFKKAVEEDEQQVPERGDVAQRLDPRSRSRDTEDSVQAPIYLRYSTHLKQVEQVNSRACCGNENWFDAARGLRCISPVVVCGRSSLLLPFGRNIVVCARRVKQDDCTGFVSFGSTVLPASCLAAAMSKSGWCEI